MQIAPSSDELHRHVSRPAVDELRQHGGEDDDPLRVCRADEEPLADDPADRLRGASRARDAEHARQLAPVTDVADPEEHEIRRADQFQRREHGVGLRDDRADPERHERQLKREPRRVPEHGRERRTPAERDAPADDKQHARPRDQDQHVDGEQELGEVARRKHA